MWLKETINDVYDANIKDDKIALLYESNKTSQVSIKTPVGITERKEIEEVVMQGGVFGGILCSLQNDKVGRESIETGENIYKYKNSVHVPSLGFVDDGIGIALCGDESLKLNVKTVEATKAKKLSLNSDKCKVLHIGKKINCCANLKVHDQSGEALLSTSFWRSDDRSNEFISRSDDRSSETV